MSFSGAPVLLAASHGTSDAIGQAAVAALVRAVAVAAPQLIVRASFVDVQQPDVPSAIQRLPRTLPVVVVPLLLSAGFHVHVDLADAARAAAPRPVTVAGALGPDPRLTVILAERLHRAGLRPGDQVVLAAAGSSESAAVEDCRAVGRQLAERLGQRVTVGFLSAASPRLADAVAEVRASAAGARVVVASYLLAPGYFAGLANTAGADLVSAPLLAEGEQPPTALVEVIIDRYAAAMAQARARARATATATASSVRRAA